MDEINAFALPDNHLIVFTGLISTCNNESELAAVLAHEIAHMELRHIIKKLIAEIGISVLLSSSNDQLAGAEVSKEIAQLLSSMAYGRSIEKEADLKAVDYLVRANINPECMAEFFNKLSYYDPAGTKQLTWVSSHNESGERAKYILEYSNTKVFSISPVLSKNSWRDLQTKISDY